MAPAPQPNDPRREQLRQQALLRRQAVLDRIVATRSLVIGGVVAISCILAGYLDASAHPKSSSAGAAGGYGNSGTGYLSNNGATPGQFGGGSPPSASSGGTAPSASSGAGSVVSGGS